MKKWTNHFTKYFYEKDSKFPLFFNLLLEQKI